MLITLSVSTFRETELKGLDRSKQSKKNKVKGKSGHQESEEMKTKAVNEKKISIKM